MSNTTKPKSSAGSDPDIYKISTIRSADGSLDLRYSVFAPKGKPTQFIVFLNGRSEYIEKYAYVAHDLDLPPNTGFLTLDNRGQGASGGARAHVDDYESFASDVKVVVDHVVGHLPYVLMAHSMGALIGLYATLSGHIDPKSLVLCSPLLGLPNKPLPRKVAKPLARFLGTCGFASVSTGAGGFEEASFATNVLTHDVERYRSIAASPYKLPGATLGWVTASFQAVDVCFAPASLTRLNAPTLVLGGSEEAVVDPDCFRNWVQAAAKHAKAAVQLCMFHGARHELLSEIPTHYDEALKATRNWFKGTLVGW